MNILNQHKKEYNILAEKTLIVPPGLYKAREIDGEINTGDYRVNKKQTGEIVEVQQNGYWVVIDGKTQIFVNRQDIGGLL